MGILVIEGYVINPYNWCVTNKVIDVRKWKILWRVDDLKLSHVSDEFMMQEVIIIYK